MGEGPTPENTRVEFNTLEIYFFFRWNHFEFKVKREKGYSIAIMTSRRVGKEGFSCSRESFFTRVYRPSEVKEDLVPNR